ncbi:MAG: hypothetical protein J0651_05020, partial [Actinobacteria bacterium]|nr:hypothetical protein [Actinomycetota bacterium]
ALEVQRQVLESLGKIEQAQVAAQLAALVAESLARGVPRASLIIARDLLAKRGRLGQQEESQKEESWNRLLR